MEISSETVTPKKTRKTRSTSANESDSIDDKANNEPETVIPNGTGNLKEDAFNEETNTNEGNLIKITKISKSAKPPLKDTAKTVSRENKKIVEKVPEPGSSSGSSLSEDFCGFDDISESDEQLISKKAFEKLISTIDKGDEEKLGEEEPDAMTVEEADAADSDSNPMEIDEGNSHADSAEFSDKNEKRTKDSDAEVMETDSVKSREVAPEKTSEVVKPAVGSTAESEPADQPKVEYCGTCNLVVDDAEEGICCDGKCERWFHLKCSGLSQTEYEELSQDENAKWACSRCSGKPPPVIKPGAKPLLSVRKDLTAIETPSPKRKMPNKEEKRPRVDISNPIFLKPFDYGWKRELVYRSTTDSASKKQGDVYYYTPKGKKLRSLREIGDHLVGTDLTADNFTFWKDALGCDPDKEIIRDAKIKMNKDATASPATTVKKIATPKTPKTPKAAPKLTATVTPLDSASGLPMVTKASASVTPRVVLKAGKTGSISTGPKFKVTPSKTTTPGQTAKIVISKGNEKTMVDHQPSSGISKNDSTNSPSFKENNQIMENIGCNGIDQTGSREEDDEVEPRKKTFRRCGLLANRVLTRNNNRKRMSKSSSSSSGGSEEEIATPEKELRPSHMTQFNVMNAAGLKPRPNNTGQSKARKENLPSCTSKFRSTPPLLHSGILLPNPDMKRPRSPEMQFRPSDPSSYGCQTSSNPLCRPVGSNIPGVSSSYQHPFETVFIVDTSPTEHSQCSVSPQLNFSPQRRSLNPPKCRNGPSMSPQPVQWTQDCSIKVFSVETLQSNGEFSNENHLVASHLKQSSQKQSTTRRTVEENINISSSRPLTKNLHSSMTARSLTTEVIVIDEDVGENSLPPFLRRETPRPDKHTESRTQSLSSLSPIPLQARPPPLYPSSLALETDPVVTINSPSSSTNSASSQISAVEASRSESTEFGTKYEEYRKLKRERFYVRAKARHEMEKLRKSYLKEKQMFLQKKSEEKRLEVEYLRLKVKIKNLKLKMMAKKNTQE